MSVSHRYCEIAHPTFANINPQSSQTMDAATSQQWKIGEGFMHLDNMFLARLESVSKGSFQPEIWVVDPTM